MRYRYTVLTVFLSLAVVLTAGSATADRPTTSEEPTPTIDPRFDGIVEFIQTHDFDKDKTQPPRPEGAPPLNFFFPGFNFDDNGVLTGTVFIPPDPIGASGPFHVVNVGNVMIQWFMKNGIQQNLQSLQSFFAPLGPPLGSFTFDPKVIFDQYSERFVVITLERLTSAPFGSYILVAVSKTSDPNLGWWYLAINSKINISGTDYWADYPGLAVGPNAIYVTNNMFSFVGSAYGGSRLWIIDKNPFYSGGAGVWTVHDPYAATTSTGSIATTTQPSHMFGTVPGGMGTFLCSYSGLSNGVQEFVQVIQVNNPLGAVSFTHQFTNVGDIENTAVALPDAPQFGTAVGIEVNDRRALNAVWRNNELWVSATILPATGPDANETTAHWFNLNAVGAGAISLNDQGNVGGNATLGTGTYTFFPALTLDKCGNMGIGFSASNSQIYAGAYYTGRLASDPAGTTQPIGVLAAGLDYYVRTFGGSRNRWGDYSGISLDPADEVTFWVFNEYASTRGTPTSPPLEDGRWATEWGSFIMGCQPVAVAITGFEARATDGGVELIADLDADSDRFRVDVYRSSGGAPTLYKSLDFRADVSFRFFDRHVKPGKMYSYYLAVEDKDGRYQSNTSSVTIPTQEIVLDQNKPNPFNPVTSIRFTLPSAEHVRLSVFDSNGKLVNQLVDGVRGVGPHTVEWNGTDHLGNKVGSGVYFYRIEAGNFKQSRKMLLLK
jgi:hypothetical protein